MRVYDFDKTVYDGDSTRDFLWHCLVHHPKLVPSVFHLTLYALAFLFNICSRESFKERCFQTIVPQIDVKATVARFWARHQRKVRRWYLDTRQDGDLIISASPDFLLRPLCEQLSVSLIATQVDVKTGSLIGNNLRGKEKVKAFREAYGATRIEAFFSDSLSDSPMAAIAVTSFFVRGNRHRPWMRQKP